jgi:membrane-associated phospholipid phosphatase
MSRGQSWWAAFAVVVAAVIVSYFVIDRPLSFFAHQHLVPHKIFVVLTYIPEAFAATSCTILAVLGIAYLSGWRLTRWQKVAMVWAVSVLVTSAIKNQLKLVFGRTWPETWTHNNPSLIRDGAYGFNPFRVGAGFESFPSGHTAAICAAMTVLWICYPRFRVLYGVLIAAVVVGLIGANYHFLSDIIAGGFVGTSVAIVTVRLAGLAPERPSAAHSGAADVQARVLTPPARS